VGDDVGVADTDAGLGFGVISSAAPEWERQRRGAPEWNGSAGGEWDAPAAYYGSEAGAVDQGLPLGSAAIAAVPWDGTVAVQEERGRRGLLQPTTSGGGCTQRSLCRPPPQRDSWRKRGPCLARGLSKWTWAAGCGPRPWSMRRRGGR